MFERRILPDGTMPPERITVMQGQALVSSEQNVEFSTVLGSCVALCLFDPDMRIGGMNHFLLAEPPASASPFQITTTNCIYSAMQTFFTVYALFFK